MGIQSGTEKRAALAYAKSQGWREPEMQDVVAVLNTEDLQRAHAKIADLDVALTAERESHVVAKAALLRKSPHLKNRIAALEAALVKLTGDDVTEDDIAAAKALLKP